MDLWRHASEGKGPVFCNETDLTTSGFARTRKVSMGWDTKKSYDFETIDSMEFMELGGRPDLRGQSHVSNPSLDVSEGEIANNFSRKLPSPASMLLSNSSFGKYESGSRLSSPVIESNSQNSSLNDMINLRQAKNCRSGFVLSSVGSSLTSKRARAANMYSPNPICQVHGCHQDLSSSKDYHKRHKVCDVHSKTAKVIVNGIEQRFCQQCSRFHLLAEFDDGKRSCRKRLAGHNERRRKPQLDILSGKPQKLLQVYEDARFLQASLAKRSSFASPDTHGSGSQGNELANQSHVKAEEVSNCSSHSMMLTANRQLLSKPVFHPNGRGNEYSSEKILSQTGCASLEMAPTVQAVSGVPNSKGALSLLSPQPKNFMSHLRGKIPMVSPLVIPGANAYSYIDQNSEIFEGVTIGEKLSPNGFWPGMDSMAFDQLQPPLVFDASCGANSFEVQVGGVFQRADSMKSESPQQVPTVDLVQLSLHLQRVEQQRNSVQMKQQNDVFCSFPSI